MGRWTSGRQITRKEGGWWMGNGRVGGCYSRRVSRWMGWMDGWEDEIDNANLPF